MENPVPNEPHPPKLAPAPPETINQRLVVIVFVSSVLIILAIITAGITIMVKQKYRTNGQAVQLASPSPPVYQSSVAGLSREEATALFLASARPVEDEETPRIQRWEHDVAIKLRGQATSADTQCLSTAMAELNPLMATSQLTLATGDSAPLEIYLLPLDQFSSVYVDAPADRPSLVLTYLNTDYSFEEVDALVDVNLPAELRCILLRRTLLQALGLTNLTTEPNTVAEQEAAGFANFTYSPNTTELIRILYSSFVAPGLTLPEAERRLLAE